MTPFLKVIPAMADYSTHPHSLTRHQFEAVHKEHGIWMVYIRADRNFPCNVCRVADSAPPVGEGNANCPVCFGLGYRVRLERDKVVLAKGRKPFPSDTDLVPGYFPDSKHRAYFPVEFGAKVHDLLLEVEWDNEGYTNKLFGEPKSIIHVYSIDQVDLLYISGEAAYSMSILDAYDHHIQAIDQAMAAKRRN